MPKQHSRSHSASHSYNPMAAAASLQASPMFTHRIPMPPNTYYGMGTPQQHHLSLAPQQQPTPQPVYDSYPASQPISMSLPPQQHRPSSGAWTAEEDQQLIQARVQGLNWGQIRDAYFPSKSPNACRKRHERLAERKGADDWDERKLEILAKEYMTMRKEIWGALAARTGEKWNVVEHKCMSNGLKNLQSAARAASRRERQESGMPYDDDSGVSGIGLTPVDEMDAPFGSPGTSHGSVPPPNNPPPQQQQQQQPQQQYAPQMQAQLSAAGYAMGYPPTTYGQHGYSSSVSSNTSVNQHGYHQDHHHQGSASPYMHAQRMSSAEMGIDAIINPTHGGAGV